MTKSFLPIGKLSAKKREFKSIVADIRHAVFSVVRHRPMEDGRFLTNALGSGFFVSPTVFVTCWHVIDQPGNADMPGDRYVLINNLDNKNSIVYDISGGVGTDIFLYPEKDFAIILCRGARPQQAFIPIGYAHLPVGAEIGVAGYPLATIAVDASGAADVKGLVYRVAKGAATAVYKMNLNAGDGYPLTDIDVLEVNFFFVPGNSGGPIFDAETGRAFAYVKGMRTPKVNEFVDKAYIDLPEGMSPDYITGTRVVYSIGLMLDRVRPELEQFGVQL
jgi:Trypsin-like peptidase domain